MDFEGTTAEHFSVIDAVGSKGFLIERSGFLGEFFDFDGISAVLVISKLVAVVDAAGLKAFLFK